MKEELNIAAILKEKPAETKLWSDTFGIVQLLATHSDSFDVTDANSTTWGYSSDGSFANYKGALCIFPSRKMRDWGKFAWKKGDVLILNGEGGTIYCVFESFEDDEYTLFKSRFAYVDGSSNSWLHFNTQSFTNHYEKASDDQAKEFIKKVEEHYGGKLNLSTLQIEKQPEFKDGDILVAEKDSYYDKVIFIASIKGDIYSKALIFVDNEDYEVVFTDYRYGKNRTLRPATDSEKQQLFDALAKENKKWDADKKMLVDLPKKCEFNTWDRVLVRDFCDNPWRIDIFGYIDEGSETPYFCVGNKWRYCIPYNDQTKHLLGTTDEWKGGEE